MTVACGQLRSAALSATRWGWPVVPGTYLGADRRWHRRQDATRLCPIQDNWRDTPERAEEDLESVSLRRAAGLRAGVDVLELPRRMLGLLSALPGEVPVV